MIVLKSIILCCIVFLVESTPHKRRFHRLDSSEEDLVRVRYYEPHHHLISTRIANKNTAEIPVPAIEDSYGDLTTNPSVVIESGSSVTSKKPIYRPKPKPILVEYVPKPTVAIEDVNKGVSTILKGVGSFRLSEILRGSFMFSNNNRVKSVANSVIDTIFGKRDPNIDNEPGVIFPLTAV